MINFKVDCHHHNTIEAVRAIRVIYKEVTGYQLGLKSLRDAVVEDGELEIENVYFVELGRKLSEAGIKVITNTTLYDELTKYQTILDSLFQLFQETADPDYIFAACEFKKTFMT